MSINTLWDNLRESITGGPIVETPDSTNLTLCPIEFARRIRVEPDGEALATLFAKEEHRVCARMGLAMLRARGDFYIPRWNNFITHLRIVNKARSCANIT